MGTVVNEVIDLSSKDKIKRNDSNDTSYPSYCQVLRFKDSTGQTKEMVFPKALDLDRPKRPRTTFSESQLNHLEMEFDRCQYLVGSERTRLANTLGLSETQIKVWFQNRRTKCKRVRGDGGSDGGSEGSEASEPGLYPSQSHTPDGGSKISEIVTPVPTRMYHNLSQSARLPLSHPVTFFPYSSIIPINKHNTISSG